MTGWLFATSLCPRTVYLAASDLDGQSTFGMKENADKKEIPLQIREAGPALR